MTSISQSRNGDNILEWIENQDFHILLVVIHYIAETYTELSHRRQRLRIRHTSQQLSIIKDDQSCPDIHIPYGSILKVEKISISGRKTLRIFVDKSIERMYKCNCLQFSFRNYIEREAFCAFFSASYPLLDIHVDSEIYSRIHTYVTFCVECVDTSGILATCLITIDLASGSVKMGSSLLSVESIRLRLMIEPTKLEMTYRSDDVSASKETQDAKKVVISILYFKSTASRQRFCGLIRSLQHQQSALKQNEITPMEDRDAVMPNIYSSSSNTPVECLNTFVGTWSCGKRGPAKDLTPWLSSPGTYDIYAIGLQDCPLKQKWMECITTHINRLATAEYSLLHIVTIRDIHLVIFVRTSLKQRIGHQYSATTEIQRSSASGFSKHISMLRNAKSPCGAAVSFMIDDVTSFCFINVQLSSGSSVEHVQRRNREYVDIIHGLRLPATIGLSDVKHQLLHQFDYVFVFGDFNYRISRGRADCKEEFEYFKSLAVANEWDQLITNDQLTQEMARKSTLVSFNEGLVSFPPTFRLARGVYPPSYFNKQNQNPSYTDRIFLKCSLPGSAQQMSYTSAFLDGNKSSHAPVMSIYNVQLKSPFTLEVQSAESSLHDSSFISFPYISLVLLATEFTSGSGNNASSGFTGSFVLNFHSTILDTSVSSSPTAATIPSVKRDMYVRSTTFDESRHDTSFSSATAPSYWDELSVSGLGTLGDSSLRLIGLRWEWKHSTSCILPCSIAEPHWLSQQHIVVTIHRHTADGSLLGYCDIPLRDVCVAFEMREEIARSSIASYRGYASSSSSRPLATLHESSTTQAYTSSFVTDSAIKSEAIPFEQPIMMDGKLVGILFGKICVRFLPGKGLEVSVSSPQVSPQHKSLTKSIKHVSMSPPKDHSEVSSPREESLGIVEVNKVLSPTLRRWQVILQDSRIGPRESDVFLPASLIVERQNENSHHAAQLASPTKARRGQFGALQTTKSSRGFFRSSRDLGYGDIFEERTTASSTGSNQSATKLSPTAKRNPKQLKRASTHGTVLESESIERRLKKNPSVVFTFAAAYKEIDTNKAKHLARKNSSLQSAESMVYEINPAFLTKPRVSADSGTAPKVAPVEPLKKPHPVIDTSYTESYMESEWQPSDTEDSNSMYASDYTDMASPKYVGLPLYNGDEDGATPTSTPSHASHASQQNGSGQNGYNGSTTERDTDSSALEEQTQEVRNCLDRTYSLSVSSATSDLSEASPRVEETPRAHSPETQSNLPARKLSDVVESMRDIALKRGESLLIDEKSAPVPIRSDFTSEFKNLNNILISALVRNPERANLNPNIPLFWLDKSCDKVCTNFGMQWRSDDFVCALTGDSLLDKPFVMASTKRSDQRDEEGARQTKRVISHAAYVKHELHRDANICSTCLIQVDLHAKDCIRSDTRLWHADHFKCVHCRKSLNPSEKDTYIEKDSFLYCKASYMELFCTCPQCFQVINPFDDNASTASDSSVLVSGQMWHGQCVRCTHCNVHLPADSSPLCWDHRDGRGPLPYCKQHYEQLVLPICPGCSTPIELSQLSDHDVVFECGQVWHRQHFRCFGSGELLTSNYYEVEGRPYSAQQYFQRFGKKCQACAGVIEGEMVTLHDQHWHAEHFVCTGSGKPLPIDEDGKFIFCEKDCLPFSKEEYVRRFCPTCYACKSPIDGPQLLFADNTYHTACFKCTSCEDDLSDREVVYPGIDDAGDVKPFCPGCYVASHNESCAACDHPLSDAMDEIVRAMGKVYHAEHFVCVICSTSLADEDARVYCHNDYPLCEKHYSELFCERCGTCEQPLVPGEDRIVLTVPNSDVEITYHETSQCFSCSLCGVSLRETSMAGGKGTCNKNIQFKDGFLLCATDMTDLFSDITCAYCEHGISSGSHLVTAGKHWHYKHACCFECGIHLDKKSEHIRHVEGRPRDQWLACKEHATCDFGSLSIAGRKRLTGEMKIELDAARKQRKENRCQWEIDKRKKREEMRKITEQRVNEIDSIAAALYKSFRNETRDCEKVVITTSQVLSDGMKPAISDDNLSLSASKAGKIVPAKSALIGSEHKIGEKKK